MPYGVCTAARLQATKKRPTALAMRSWRGTSLCDVATGALGKAIGRSRENYDA